MHSNRLTSVDDLVTDEEKAIKQCLSTEVAARECILSATVDGFCEFSSPLRKKCRKESRTKLESKELDLENKTNLLEKPRGIPSFARRLKDKMMNNLKIDQIQDIGSFNLREKCNPDNTFNSKNSRHFLEKSNEPKEPCYFLDVSSKSETQICENSKTDEFYGLPKNVKSLFWVHQSISDLYEWQKNCLEMECKTPASNLIYSLPTSGGKTLVAEILMLKQVICHQKNVLFVLPYVAIVQEKIKSLTPFGVDLNFLVEEYAGNKGKLPPKRHRKKSIYVGTIEKAASLVNSLIESMRIAEIGLVVVDELHMIGEGGNRGSTLETMLTKIMFSSPSTKLVGMSATFSNIEDLKTFLKAQLYVNNFRPVELKEFVKVSDRVYEVNADSENKLEFLKFVSFKDMYTKETSKQDPDHLLGLVMEVAPKDSCLIFCSTKKICENVAQLLCNIMPNSMRNVKTKERQELLKRLRADEGQICPILEKTVPYGVAYHHSGLTGEERKLIEEAYFEGSICVITCTSTLAAGVNLPAKRVILRSPYIGREVMSRTQYKQMVGRAGRAGFHSYGESYLITSTVDTDKVLPLLGNLSETCQSSLLHKGSKGLASFILSSIGLKVITSTTELAKILKLTMCYTQLKNVELVVESNICLKELIDEHYVVQRISTEDGVAELDVTKLGRAIFKGSIDPKLGKKLYNDLQNSLSNLVLSSHLHLLYIVTPYELMGQVDIQWMTYLNEVFTLSKEEGKLLQVLGISETYLHRKASGMSFKNTGASSEEVVKRFYLTLMLNMLLKKESLWEVANKFETTRGFVQNLLSATAAFASSIYHFCQELDDMWPYQNLLPNLIRKLSYCCSIELIPLLEIPGVKIGRARLMYKAGYQTVQQVAQSSVDQFVREVDLMPRRVARQIIAAAQMVVKEKLEDLIQDVHELVPIPMINSQYNTPDFLQNDSLDIINISQMK